MIKFSHTIFYVKNVLKAVQFYEACFGFTVKFLHESNSYAELDTEGVTLAFASEELGKMNLPKGFQPNRVNDLPQGCEIALLTDTPEVYYQKALDQGAIALYPLQPKPWGQIVGYVRDPEGILIEIAGRIA